MGRFFLHGLTICPDLGIVNEARLHSAGLLPRSPAQENGARKPRAAVYIKIDM